jgi:hypothetical protein
VVTTFGVLGSLGYAVGSAVETNPERVAVAAAQIADFNLPSGYRSEATINLGGFIFVSYAPGDGRSHILLVQAPRSIPVDQAALEQVTQQALANQGRDHRAHTQVVGQMKATIRGREVTLVLSEGTNSSGQAYRVLTGVFEGKGGPTLLSIESPVARWDQAVVNAFVTSIR